MQKLTLTPKILDFLAKERVCALSVALIDGTPHTAAMHYSHQINPVKLFFQTGKDSVKMQSFLKDSSKASIVVGFSEKDLLTLQMRGGAKIVSTPKELEEIYKIHYKKHPFAEKYKGPETVFIEFVPTWWRYTDFNTEPETIFEG